MVVNHCLTVALVMENALVCFKQATKNGHILQDLSSCARKETKSATEIKRDAKICLTVGVCLAQTVGLKITR